MCRALTVSVLLILGATLSPPGPGRGGGAGAQTRNERQLEVTPRLPATAHRYEDDLPSYLVRDDGLHDLVATDNTPDHNPVTNDGATLGRVLFYDTRLSRNRTVSCGSCHQQAHGFSDPRPLSLGYDGRPTRRRSMGLSHARYYSRGHFFWDERADTLETQVLVPIQDPVEMGLSLTELLTRLGETSFYPPLFSRSFGSTAITNERIARALAQFVRALVSFRSPYDEARADGPAGSLPFERTLGPLATLGHRLFVTVPGTGRRGAGCNQCHVGEAQISLSPRNIGLDAATTGDLGAGDGRFKAPSLRNVAVRGPYMHDGRFETLHDVIDHYDGKVVANPFLDMTLLNRRLAVTGGPVTPTRLELSDVEKDSLVAFLETLTDRTFLTDPRFSNPFLTAE